MDDVGAGFLSLRGLSKTFPQHRGGGETIAVDDVSVEVTAGEMVTLLGPSGCGKTTTLRMVAGFEQPTSGSVIMGGRDVTSVPASKRHIGMVFQNYALFPHLDVGSNVEYGLRVQRIPRAQRRKRVMDMLDLVGLADAATRMPNQLSGGQQQRVSLARAIVTEPQILLFDEPLSNLDANLRVYMRNRIREIQQRVGITSIYVTHDRQEAMAVSDRIVVLRDGVLQQIGNGLEIYNRPANRFVAEFMGAAEFIDCTVRDVRGAEAVVDFGPAGFPEVTARVRENGVSATVGMTMSCVLRPESWQVGTSDASDVPAAPDASAASATFGIARGASTSAAFNGTVLRSAFYGPCVEYLVQLGEREITIEDYDVNNHGIRHAGDVIEFGVKPGAAGLMPADDGGWPEMPRETR